MAEAQENSPASPEVQRAEEMVNEMERKLRAWSSVIGLNVLRFLARAREEAEDIYAEAESLSRGQK